MRIHSNIINCTTMMIALINDKWNIFFFCCQYWSNVTQNTDCVLLWNFDIESNCLKLTSNRRNEGKTLEWIIEWFMELNVFSHELSLKQNRACNTIFLWLMFDFISINRCVSVWVSLEACGFDYILHQTLWNGQFEYLIFWTRKI